MLIFQTVIIIKMENVLNVMLHVKNVLDLLPMNVLNVKIKLT